MLKKEVTIGEKVFVISEDKSSGYRRIENKAMIDRYEPLYGGRKLNPGIDEERMSLAVDAMKVSSSNASVLAAFKIVFTPTEMEELKDESLTMGFIVNGEGQIIRFYFSSKSEKWKNLCLEQYSLLEDKLLEVLKFYIPDPGIEHYGLFTVPISFRRILEDGYALPRKIYLNP
jgi:hypothetical protein